MPTTGAATRGRKTLMRALASLVLLTVVAAGCAGTPPTGGGGTLPTSTVAVPATAGFGGGNLYYPTTGGPYGVVSLSPGFTENAAALAHWGPYLASAGFVVIIINTTSGLITPEQRSTEQLQALQYVIQQGSTSGSPIAGKVDPNRKAVGGHSMGGGASFISAANDPSLDAVLPLAPWNLYQLANITSPTLVLACQSDTIAPVTTNASPLYEAIQAGTEKQYVSVAAGDHFCVNSPNAAGAGEEVGQTAVAFLRRFVNGNTSVVGELCGAGAPTEGTLFDDIRSTCPF
jgi:predicted dienelactone hydrolase